MALSIRKAAVMGAGVMGSSIAGLLASAGIFVDLMDIVPPNETKNKNILAENAKKNLLKAKGVFDKESLDLIRPGNFEDDFEKLKEVDWIIEVIVEKIEVKLELYEKIKGFISERAIVSSNTSGLSIEEMASRMPEKIKERFMGVHFFNPVRYMKLVEVIPSKVTDEKLVEQMTDFIRTRLGKGTVLAKDTPNFIANRIGCYSSIRVMELSEKYGLDFAEADALSGTVIGRSNSATYRTTDIVGLDTSKLIFESMSKLLKPEEAVYFKTPKVITELVEKGFFGDKNGSGFFKRIRKPEKKVLKWDSKSNDYIDFTLKLPDWLTSLGKNPTPSKVIWAAKDSNTDSGKFIWEIVKAAFVYSVNKTGEITDDFRKIDLCMQWGYNWLMGPFSIFEEMGPEKTLAVYESEGEIFPDWIKNIIKKNKGSLFNENKYDDLLPKMITVKTKTNKLVEATEEVSLIDIGDGVGLLEFHTKGNALSSTMSESINKMLFKANEEFDALVIGNNGKNFSAGANLDGILQMSNSGNSEKLLEEVKTFQDMNKNIKYFGKPIVAAPFGMTLGGGCEVSIHSSSILAQAETYMGLVEVGVGLIPGGGGTKEMAIRVAEVSKLGVIGDDYATLLRNWQTVAFGKVSSSGLDAYNLGFLKPNDLINMDAFTQLKEAKEYALSLKIGYRPPVSNLYAVKGNTGIAMLKIQIETMLEGNWISKYDAYLGEQVAIVMCGGNVPEGTLLSEEELLKLERETFVKLALKEETRQRIKHMLETGKRLAN